jgi:hypothetical protein
MVNEQKHEVKCVFEELDLKFTQRTDEIDITRRDLSTIVRDIKSNMRTISTLTEQEFQPIILKYRNSLEWFTKKMSSFDAIEKERIELLNPKVEPLRHLADIIHECRMKLKTFKKAS